MKIPLNICLFTSTQGHWKIKTRFLETIESLNEQIPLNQFSGLFAHIKVSPKEEDFAALMEGELEHFGFTVLKTTAEWSHSVNHQEEYLKDITKVFSDKRVNQTPYTLFLEDDFIIVPWKGKLIDYIAKATKILDEDPDIVSVRICRAKNEQQRILGLREKHGIDSHVSPAPRGYEFSHFLASDFSNNPHLVRTRDMRTAMQLIRKINGFPIHSEHGTAAALKLLSNSKTPIAIFQPNNIVCRHIGTEIGAEEPLNEEIELS